MTVRKFLRINNKANYLIVLYKMKGVGYETGIGSTGPGICGDPKDAIAPMQLSIRFDLLAYYLGSVSV